jgi:hypothetical protein
MFPEPPSECNLTEAICGLYSIITSPLVKRQIGDLPSCKDENSNYETSLPA